MGVMSQASHPIQIGYEFYRKVDGAWYGYVFQSLDGLNPDQRQDAIEEFRAVGIGSGDNGDRTWAWVKENDEVSRTLDAITQAADSLGIRSFGDPFTFDYQKLPVAASTLLTIFHAATGGVTITDHAGFAPFYNQKVTTLGQTGVLPKLTTDVVLGVQLFRSAHIGD